MNFEHAGKDYRVEAQSAFSVLREPLRIESLDVLVPFNPVVSMRAPARVAIAFFGLNAYSGHLAEARGEENFLIWAINGYSAKVFRVMERWHEGLRALDGDQEAGVYYSNFVKVVLPEGWAKNAVDVERAMDSSTAAMQLFTELACEELLALKKSGCRLFVCFGAAAFRYMSPAAERAGIVLIQERHFSRNHIGHTAALIQEAMQESVRRNDEIRKP